MSFVRPYDFGSRRGSSTSGSSIGRERVLFLAMTGGGDLIIGSAAAAAIAGGMAATAASLERGRGGEWWAAEIGMTGAALASSGSNSSVSSRFRFRSAALDTREGDDVAGEVFAGDGFAGDAGGAGLAGVTGGLAATGSVGRGARLRRDPRLEAAGLADGVSLAASSSERLSLSVPS